MKALVINKNDWEKERGFKQIEVSQPKLDEKNNPNDAKNVIIKVNYAGFCGSDRSLWFRSAFRKAVLGSLEKESKDFRIIGHELLGEIVEIGSKAKEKFGLDIGDTVSTESHIFCGTCYQCKLGEHHVCTNEYIIGITRDGCFAEYIKLPAKVLWQTYLEKIRAEVACLQEPFGNAVFSCSQVDLRGKRVGIFGCGTIGLFTILVAKALGASKVIGIEPDQAHRKLAKELGVDEMIDIKPISNITQDMNVIEKIKDLTNGVGLDVAIEMAGFNSSVNNAIMSTRRGGHIILFGIKEGDFVVNKFDKMIIDGKKLHCVIGRDVYNTWPITKSLLEAKENGIQEKIYKKILKEGKGTIIDFHQYDKDTLEKAIKENPKVVLKF